MALVLVLEDDLAVADLLREYLLREGHAVLRAGDGDSAIALAARHRPDLLLTDIWMPGTDGLEAARRIKGAPETAGCVVIFVTALTTQSVRQQAMALGAAAFLTKPFELEELGRTVRTALSAGQKGS